MSWIASQTYVLQHILLPDHTYKVDFNCYDEKRFAVRMKHMESENEDENNEDDDEEDTDWIWMKKW